MKFFASIIFHQSLSASLFPPVDFLVYFFHQSNLQAAQDELEERVRDLQSTEER